jgi:predicted dehydrogenase
VDTVAASLRFESGLIGTYTSTYSTGSPWKPMLYVVGDKGAMRLHRGEIELTVGDTTSHLPTANEQSIHDELADCARLVREGGENRSSPQDALQDVAVIEALLQSAQTGNAVTPTNVL